jgi:hypothetical protein
MSSVSAVARLAVGVEVIDVMRGGPAAVSVRLEDVPAPHSVPVPAGVTERARALYDPGIGLPALHSARPGRFALVLPRESPAHVRIVDERRRYVPRRLEIPFAELDDVLAEEAATQEPPYPRMTARGRHVRIFPGACYEPHPGATGVRGQVLDAAGRAVRWTRVRARHTTQDVELGVAHGDDRGEFLLVLGSPAGPLAVPTATEFPIEVTVTAPPAPALTGPVGTSEDPLADLPVEVMPPLGGPGPDDVSAGTAAPPGFTASVTATVTCRLGRLVSPSPFVLP